MAILAAMQSAAIRLVSQRPSVFFGSSEQVEIELCDLVNEVATECFKDHDWQALTSLHTLTGDGTTEDFDLPADYDRQLISSDLQDLQSWAWGYSHISDINEFVYMKEFGWNPLPGAWIIYGNKMRFAPAPTSNATFPYIRNTYAIDAATLQPKPAFTADTDTFALSERLLTLGLVWKWRESKKLDYSGDQEAFESALSKEASRDRGSRIYRKGRRNQIPNTYVAWPWQLG